MLLSKMMITGFNTDVQHEGHTYHVQSEDRGRDNPVLESLIYVGGTIIAKKRTPYADKLTEGATEETIAALLKRQHQVIIAAIKAGRINDLIRHSTADDVAQKVKRGPNVITQPQPALNTRPTKIPTAPVPPARPSVPLQAEPTKPAVSSKRDSSGTVPPMKRRETRSLDIDKVISDYLKKNEETSRLDLKVISPDVFIAGKSIALRVLTTHESRPVSDAIVTIKIIGTAFKPQVFIGRSGRDGMANFSLALPLFTAGTAAIVIEAQAGEGRGELKHLIRRA